MKTSNINHIVFLSKSIISILIASLLTLAMILISDLSFSNINIIILNFILFLFVGYSIYDVFKQLYSFNSKRSLIVYLSGIILSLVFYIIDEDSKSATTLESLFQCFYYIIIGGSFFYLFIKLIQNLKFKKKS